MKCEYITPKKRTMKAPYGIWLHIADGVTIVSFWTKQGTQVSMRSRAPFTEDWWQRLRSLYTKRGPRCRK